MTHPHANGTRRVRTGVAASYTHAVARRMAASARGATAGMVALAHVETAVTDDRARSVSVAGVVVDDHDRVLAIQRSDSGDWEPPGGVLELGESVEAGLAREVREETGCIVDAVALTGVYNNVRRGVVALVFRCRLLGEGRPSDREARATCWLTRSEVAQRMKPVFAMRVMDALDGRDAPPVRNHDGARIWSSACWASARWSPAPPSSGWRPIMDGHIPDRDDVRQTT